MNEEKNTLADFKTAIFDRIDNILDLRDETWDFLKSKHTVPAFNAEASRIDAKWRPARTIDDFGRMKEADFLERIAAISVIGKNVKEELIKCLKFRNGCGHPNSMKIGPNAVAGHIEILLLNVFKVFA